MREFRERLNAAVAGRDVSEPGEPDAGAVRGAVDWILYWYSDRSRQGEEDQTSATYWALGRDLAHRLIDMTVTLAALREAGYGADSPDALEG